MSTTKSTDRIEKQIQLDSPRSRVWRALTDAGEFGKWFGVDLQGAFAAGATVRGKITSKGYEHVTFEALVERLDPEHFFSFHWHPYAIDPGVDYSKEPRTLVAFTLEPVDGGTLLTVVESGFDAIPASRRVKAFEMDSNGWASQMQNIRKHLAANR
jgi:uncharacterized protein YndB with AHSA1/START domain